MHVSVPRVHSACGPSSQLRPWSTNQTVQSALVVSQNRRCRSHHDAAFNWWERHHALLPAPHHATSRESTTVLMRFPLRLLRLRATLRPDTWPSSIARSPAEFPCRPTILDKTGGDSTDGLSAFCGNFWVLVVIVGDLHGV
ncbi:BZIP transcription factor [Musa troglodytarum]|uniref:BZIP transcription factor n=1 Tax=Musa troglodytarum TaxID=320322 RepID=A0A9E7KZ68_9LILI|nr:BZIP transcription factor [Musa troglodytarum]